MGNRDQFYQTGESRSPLEEEKRARIIRGLRAFWLLNTVAIIALIVALFVYVIPWKDSEIKLLDPKIIIPIALRLILPLVLGFVPVAFTHSASSENKKPGIESLWKEFTLVFICCLLTLLFYCVTGKTTIWLDIGFLSLSVSLYVLSGIHFLMRLKTKES